MAAHILVISYRSLLFSLKIIQCKQNTSAYIRERCWHLEPMLYKKLRPQFTNVRNKLECFVPGRLFLPSLMFVGEVWSLCKSEALKVLHLGVLWPYQETLHLAGKISKEQTL